MLKTVADELLDLVRKRKRLSVEEAAKELKSPLQSIQSIVDFLVEEKVFGIEYKFTTPYIYLYDDNIKPSILHGKWIQKKFMSKEEFYKNAARSKIPHDQIERMWHTYLENNLPLIKEEFFRKAKERGAADPKIRELWNKYISYL